MIYILRDFAICTSQLLYFMLPTSLLYTHHVTVHFHTLHTPLYQSRPNSLHSVQPGVIFNRLLRVAGLGALVNQYWEVMRQSTQSNAFT